MQKTSLEVRGPVHTNPFSKRKRSCFAPDTAIVHTSTPKMITENHSKTLSRVERFANDTFWKRCFLGPVHINPFSNENGAVFLRFQEDLRPHLSFSPVHNVVSVLKTLLYPQCACSNELDACAFQYIGLRNWRHSWFFVSVCPPFWILTVEWSGLFMTSPFSDSIVFSVHTRKQRFQKTSFSNRSILESVFE